MESLGEAGAREGGFGKVEIWAKQIEAIPGQTLRMQIREILLNICLKCIPVLKSHQILGVIIGMHIGDLEHIIIS